MSCPCHRHTLIPSQMVTIKRLDVVQRTKTRISKKNIENSQTKDHFSTLHQFISRELQPREASTWLDVADVLDVQLAYVQYIERQAVFTNIALLPSPCSTTL